jgi:hypothetical protein
MPFNYYVGFVTVCSKVSPLSVVHYYATTMRESQTKKSPQPNSLGAKVCCVLYQVLPVNVHT